MTWPVVLMTLIWIVTAGALLYIGPTRRFLGLVFSHIGQGIMTIALWIALAISYLVGHTPAWLASVATGIATAATATWTGIQTLGRILLRVLLVLAALGIIVTIVLFALFRTGHYDAMAVIFLVLAVLTLPFCIFFSWVKSWFGLRSARLLLSLFIVLLFSAVLSLAMGSFVQLFSYRMFYILTAGALLIAPLLAWWWWGRVLLILGVFPLIWFALLAENRPLLASIRGWFEAEIERETAANNLEAAKTREKATQAARAAVPYDVNAKMTIGHVLRPIPVFEVKFGSDGKPSSVVPQKDASGNIVFLPVGTEFLTASPKPVLEILTVPAHHILLRDKKTGAYLGQVIPTPRDEAPQLFIEARDDNIRLEQELTAPVPISEMEEVDQRWIDIVGAANKTLVYDAIIPAGHRLFFPEINPKPASGDLEVVIGFERYALEPDSNIEVKIASKPLFVVRGQNTYKLYVQDFAPKGTRPVSTPTPAAVLRHTPPPSVALRITNARSGNIFLHWLDENGNERRWSGAIPPGRTLKQNSYLVPGQWVVRDASGVELARFPPPGAETHHTI